MNRLNTHSTLHGALPFFIAACMAVFSVANADNRVTPPPKSRTPTPVPSPSASPAPSAAPASPSKPRDETGRAVDLQAGAGKNRPGLDEDRDTGQHARVIVSLTKQRAYLYVGDQIAIDTPVSTGKRAGMTPTGNFTVLEKDPNHKSNIFGNFVDGKGRVVRGGISLKIDSAPSGTHYEGSADALVHAAHG